MTAKDLELIAAARDTPWEDIFDLEEQAETEEARLKLHSIASDKYHYDEYLAGIQ